MLGWFKALLPREERFFDLFEDHVRIIQASAEALRGMLNSDASGIDGQCRAVMDREVEADRVTREVLIAVRRTFITPFDRGDIRQLITAMDDVVDEMQRTAKCVSLYDIEAFEPEMRQVGDAIVDCARLVGQAVPLLRNINREAGHIGSLAEEISAIEGKADDLHDSGLKALFRRHVTPSEMPFIVGAALYERLEAVVDRFDDVGNELNSIVIEHV